MRLCIIILILLIGHRAMGQDKRFWFTTDSESYRIIKSKNVYLFETWNVTAKTTETDSVQTEVVVKKLLTQEVVDSNMVQFLFSELIEMKKHPDSTVVFYASLSVKEYSKPINFRNFFLPWTTETISAGKYKNGVFTYTPLVQKTESFNWSILLFLIGCIHWIYLMTNRKNKLSVDALRTHTFVQCVCTILGLLLFLVFANVWRLVSVIITVIVVFVIFTPLLKKHTPEVSESM